jgi:hypothetical protein
LIQTKGPTAWQVLFYLLPVQLPTISFLSHLVDIPLQPINALTLSLLHKATNKEE